MSVVVVMVPKTGVASNQNDTNGTSHAAERRNRRFPSR
jgi:hypothetical protein